MYKVKIIYYLYYKYNLSLANKHVYTFVLIAHISIISIISNTNGAKAYIMWALYPRSTSIH